MKIYQVVINCIGENISALVKTGKCVVLNTADATTDGYYVIKLYWEAYTLQEYTTCDFQICTAGKLVVKAQYLGCMQDNTKW